MTVVALILAAVAALVHVFIFYLESVAWTGPKARASFGLTEQQALATKDMAFNQGFYNLFLAVIVGVGIALSAAAGAVGAGAAGVALVFAGAGSMAGAALVLFVSSPDKRGAALKQGAIPALAVAALAVGLAL